MMQCVQHLQHGYCNGYFPLVTPEKQKIYQKSLIPDALTRGTTIIYGISNMYFIYRTHADRSQIWIQYRHIYDNSRTLYPDCHRMCRDVLSPINEVMLDEWDKRTQYYIAWVAYSRSRHNKYNDAIHHDYTLGMSAESFANMPFSCMRRPLRRDARGGYVYFNRSPIYSINRMLRATYQHEWFHNVPPKHTISPHDHFTADYMEDDNTYATLDDISELYVDEYVTCYIKPRTLPFYIKELSRYPVNWETSVVARAHLIKYCNYVILFFSQYTPL